MALPSFTISQTPKLTDILGDVVGSDLVSRRLFDAEVLFTCNVAPNDFVMYQGNLHRVRPVLAHVNTAGSIERDYKPVQLLANDPDLNVTNIQWTIEVRVDSSLIKKWTFNAPLAGTVLNLASVAPVPATGPNGVTHGARSKVVPVDPEDPDTLYQWVDEYGTPFGVPVEIPTIITTPVAEAAATAAAETVTPDIVTADIESRDPQVIPGSTPGTVRYSIGDALGPEFPSNAVNLDGIAVPDDDGKDFAVAGNNVVTKNPTYIDPTQAPYNVKPDGRTFGTAVMSSSSNPTHLAVTAFFTAITVSGSPVLAGISRYDDIAVGKALSGTGIPVGAVVQSINESGTVTMSANATAAGINVAIYTPYTWTAADVGKVAKVLGAGASNASLKTTVASVNTLLNRGVLADPALTTVSNKFAIFGTDNAAALDKLYADISHTGARLGRAAMFGQGVVMHSGTMQFPFGGAVKGVTGNPENMFVHWGRTGGQEVNQGTVFYQIWDQNVDCARVRDASTLQHDWGGCLEGFVIMQDAENSAGKGLAFRNAVGDAVRIIDGGSVGHIYVAGAAEEGWEINGIVGNGIIDRPGAWGCGYETRRNFTADTNGTTTLSNVSSFTGLKVGGIISCATVGSSNTLGVDNVIMSLSPGTNQLTMRYPATATTTGLAIQQAGAAGIKYNCYGHESATFIMPSGDQNSMGLMHIVGTGTSGPPVAITLISIKNEMNVNAGKEQFISALSGGSYAATPSIPQGANMLVEDNAGTVDITIVNGAHQAGSGSSVGGPTPNPMGRWLGAAVLSLPTGGKAATVTWWGLALRAAASSGQSDADLYQFRDTHSANTLPIKGTRGTNRTLPRPFRKVSDVNAVMSLHDCTVEWDTLTASRTCQLPQISQVPPGHPVSIRDGSGSATTSRTITGTPFPGDPAIAGDTVVATAYGAVDYINDGVKWMGSSNAKSAAISQRFTANGTFTAPVAGTYAIEAWGGGGGGGGGGAAALTSGTSTQVGGAGGGAGQSVKSVVTLAASDTLTVVVGAGGAGGTGGAASSGASGNAGTTAAAGSSTTVGNVSVGTLTALGGSAGVSGGANSASTVNAGTYGGAVTGGTSANSGLLGSGGTAQSTAGLQAGQGVGYSGRGGGGGSPANATNGGSAGTGAFITSKTGSANGASASNAPANSGQGGDGGGGGAPGGAGGNGANGGSGGAIITRIG